MVLKGATMTITTTTTITYTHEDGWSIEIPMTPCDHFYGLPKDGVVVADDEVRFLVNDDSAAWNTFEDMYGQYPHIVFKDFSQDRSMTAEMFNDTIEELRADGYTVYLVGKYEHGLVSYSLHSEAVYPDMQWDYAIAGVIGVKDVADTETVARSHLQDYTAWCNGSVYTVVSVPRDNPDEWSSCGGFLGDSAIDAVKEGGF